jgi:hypothetical protein
MSWECRPRELLLKHHLLHNVLIETDDVSEVIEQNLVFLHGKSDTVLMVSFLIPTCSDHGEHGRRTGHNLPNDTGKVCRIID